MAIKRKLLSLIKQPELIEILQAELGVTDAAVRKWLKAGRLPAPAVNISGKSRYWRRSDIDEFLGKQAA